MSKYHEKCIEQNPEDDEQKKPSKKKPALKSKPFCDCIHCNCKDCPDILKLLSVTVTDTTCTFGPKVTVDVDANRAVTPPREDSLLNVLNPALDCDCEMMARAVRSNLHMKFSMHTAIARQNEPAKSEDNEEDNKSPK